MIPPGWAILPFAPMPPSKLQRHYGQMLWCRDCACGWSQPLGGDNCWLCGGLGHLRLTPEKAAA